MEGIGMLNIEYFFAHLYQAVSGVQVDFSQIPAGGLFLLQLVAIFGVVTSVILLVLTIHFHIRTLQVEHAGFHALEAALHAQHSTHEPKNSKWEGVTVLASSPNESDWRRAILEADILLAALLTERGYVGESVGEQLKNANPLQFTTLDIAWEAHRMRNALAHMGDAFPLSERDTRATIDQFRRVFEEFDYI
jgi:hypothetical protein